tara:strand:- start:893 stop:1135 length:243 start_codon:yes stop_codon:yes gene_type:complete
MEDSSSEQKESKKIAKPLEYTGADAPSEPIRTPAPTTQTTIPYDVFVSKPVSYVEEYEWPGREIRTLKQTSLLDSIPRSI